MMRKKGRRKESTGRRITKRTKAFQSSEKLYFTLRIALLYSQKSFTLLIEKLYFTLKRLFAIESSSQLAFRLLLYLRKALLYSRKALLYSKASLHNWIEFTTGVVFSASLSAANHKALYNILRGNQSESFFQVLWRHAHFTIRGRIHSTTYLC